MKKLNPTLKSALVLACVIIACGCILFVAHIFLGLTDEQKLGATLNSLIKNDGATIEYNYNDQAITDFNNTVPARERIFGKVLRVYKLVKGTNGEKYVIEAEGEGYLSNSVSLIALNQNGTVYAVAVKQYGESENLAYRINQNELSQLVSQISNENLLNDNLAKQLQYEQLSSVASATGAPITLGGIISSINISALFYKEVILKIPPKVYEQIETVTDSEVLSNLNDLLAIDGQSSSVFYRISDVKTEIIFYENVGKANELNQAQIVCGFVTDSGQLILQVVGEGYSGTQNRYGIWEVYMLINDNNLIQAVKIISNTARPQGGNYSYLSELLNDLFLTNQFKNKDANYFAQDNNLPFHTDSAVGTATQTNNGIKVCGYITVTNASQMRNLAQNAINANGLPLEVQQ